MAAPFVIPFNFQPANTGVATSNYTVPSGKYARLNLSACVLPTLNGTALTYSKSYTLFSASASTQSISGQTITSPSVVYRDLKGKMDRVVVTNTNGGGGAWGYTSFAGGPGMTSQVSSELAETSGSASSNTSTNLGKMDGFKLASGMVTNDARTVSITVDYSFEETELWLKAGDVLAFTEGRLQYVEFNVIS